MANEIRRRDSFAAGGLSVGLSTVDTTMQSNGLQDLGALASDEYFPLSLFRTDALGRVTQKEVVYMTAHSAAAGSGTILRAREGTTAQVWSIGDRWALTDTALDNLVVCKSTTRPSAPYAGLPIYEYDTHLTRVWTGAKWRAVEHFAPGAWPNFLNGVALDTETHLMIVQGGTAVVSTNANGDFTITYPNAFPNGIGVFIVLQGDNTHGGATYVPYLGGNSLSAQIVRVYTPTGAVWANSGNMRISWLAIGW